MRRPLLALILCGAAAFAESAGGLKWTAPPAWKAQPERPMRVVTYTVPKAAGDKEDGECAVFYFGPNQGGGVDANIQRWIGQFDSPAEKTAKTSKSKVNGLPVTRLEVSGTYKPSGGAMMRAQGTRPNYRMLGAIVEGPQGAVFFKFTAPAKTVAAQQPAFEGMLKSVSR
jgi:hypothetical protein